MLVDTKVLNCMWIEPKAFLNVAVLISPWYNIRVSNLLYTQLLEPMNREVA